ncbi:protein FAM32A-like [Argonauta hians]
MSDAYTCAKGSLKLKKNAKVHKKSSESKSKSKKLKKSLENVSNDSQVMDNSLRNIPKQTKAEIAFEKARDKKLVEQIMERASKSHKERIMDFNRHLDTLTEHFDIPKVSWTK